MDWLRQGSKWVAQAVWEAATIFTVTRLFILYSADLADIAEKHGVTIHSFTDDTQLYLLCVCEDTSRITVRLEHWIADINHWMSASRLKLNTRQEFLWAGTKNCLSLYDGSFPCLQLGANTVLPSQHVRVLVVVISSDLSLEKYVSRVSASSFHYLRQLRRIQRSLNSDSVATLIHAFVTSRVDYCNATFAGAPKITTNKFQRVLNAAAGVVTGTRKCDRGLTQLLHTELHWLDVPERVKLSVMVHRCLNGRAPQYLATLCVPVQLLQWPPGNICVLPFVISWQ